MRRSLSILILALLAAPGLFAQTDAPPPDDMPFGLIMGIILLCVALACMAAGTILAILALTITLVMASAGIISTAIVVGLYKRSVTAGFKTLLIVISSIGGVVVGLTGLYFVNRVFTLHLAQPTVVWSGIAGGLIGGILLALVIISIIRVLIGLFKEKLSLGTPPPSSGPR